MDSIWKQDKKKIEERDDSLFLEVEEFFNRIQDSKFLE